MDISGNQLIPAGREEVWRALNDPEVLKACIPGCDSLEKTSDTEMNAQVTTKIGPVKAKFKGAVTLENINPPESYTITGEGKGGVAGFAKGGADVKLSEADGGTMLEYSAKAQVGGKLAQLGSRLIDSTARKMAEEFFTKFSETVAGPRETELREQARGGTCRGSGASQHLTQVRMHGAASQPARPVETAVSAGTETPSAADDTKVFGGPMVWGLLALGVLVVVLALLI